MAGQPKPQLRVGDATMLEHVLLAVRRAGTRVVVGPPQPVPDGVLRIQEQPPASGPVAGLAAGPVNVPASSGPVAALAAGVAQTSAEVVVVVAADLPFLTSELIDAVVAGLGEDVDVALVVDENGREQFLLSAWRTGRLRTALTELEPLPGRAMKDLVRALRIARIRVSAPQNAPVPWTDVDTPAELDRARSQSSEVDHRQNEGFPAK